jgi:hypothetical protein
MTFPVTLGKGKRLFGDGTKYGFIDHEMSVIHTESSW